MQTINIMHTFYDLSKFTTAQLRKFFKYCVFKSYDSHMEYIPNDSFRRRYYNEIPIGTFINKMVSTNAHNVFIVRKRPDENHIEAGSSTLIATSIFLYIFIHIDKLNEIVEKFNLKPLEQ